MPDGVGARPSGGASGAGTAETDRPRLVDALPVGAVLWLAGVVLWATRMPFLPREGPAAITLAPPGSVLEMAGNLLLMAPLGLLLGHGAARSGRGRRTHLGLWACLAAACLLVEAGQLLVEGRVVSFYDVGLNLAGATAGQWLGARLGRGAPPGPGRTRAALRGVLVATFAGVSLFLLSRARVAEDGFRLRGWDPAHRVVVGDEVGGGRSYRGTIADAHICAPADGGAVCASGGADPGTRRRLARAAGASQAVRLEARVRSASSRQTGPTRIVTFSGGQEVRNATLAQSNDDLVFRVRTPLGGPNGVDVPLRLRDAVPLERPTRVTAVYRRGTVRLAAGRGDDARSVAYSLTPTWLYTWLVAGRADPGHRLQPLWAALAGAVVLLLPAGLGAARVVGGRGRAAALAAGAAAGAVVFATVSVALELPPPAWACLAAGGVAAAAAAVGMRDRRVLCERDTT